MSANELLILISTRRAHRDFRALYRKVYQNFQNIHVKFLTGLGPSEEDDEISSAIGNEIAEYNDIVVGDIVDDSENQNLKKLFGYTFVQGIET